MSLLSFSNIAGPSRLPLQVTVTACRRAVAARFYATEAQEPQEPLAAEQSEQSAPVDELSALTLDPSTPATRSGLEKREGRIFYRDWLRYEGEQFRVPQKGQKAKWLGGNVPYPSNPSFRPPPPLSNHIQDQVFADLQRGQSVAELSVKYNISKARVEAIQKLKEIETEYKRRSLPLQTAFLEGMEPLLGVRTPISPRTRQHDPALARELDLAHEAHPSTAAERLEEQRFDAGIGEEGAFGQRTRESTKPSIERTVWEFMDEESALLEKETQGQKTREKRQRRKEREART